MEKIILNRIIKENNIIKYDFSVSDGLSKYFSGKPFIIEYQEDITCVPDSIVAVPFVCNVLPIIWLTDSELVLDELDKAFFECIPEVRKGYETMFPESCFLGKLCVQNTVEHSFDSKNQSGMLFSGGVDSVNTLVSHLSENPYLFAVWGSDIKYNSDSEWNSKYQQLLSVANKFNLKLYTVKSTFREFDLEDSLNQDFFTQLKDQWWHGVKHSLALLGHMAPYAYLKQISSLYIASTNCPEDEPVRCASNPLTDNYVRFSNCRVIHDGYRFNRQQKVANIVGFCEKEKITIPFHVCWESAKGNNCCNCEKCYRTILALIAEGAEPMSFGFFQAEDSMKKFREYFVRSSALDSKATSDFWRHIQNRMRENTTIVKKSVYWRNIKWFMVADLTKPESLKESLNFRIKGALAKFAWYRGLSKIKKGMKR